MKMNKFGTRLGTWLLSVVSLFSACGAIAQTKTVSILTYQQDEASAEMVEGVREVLRSAGFREGRNLKLNLFDAQGTPERAQQLALVMVRGRPDVIVTLTLPATLAALTYTKQIPVVFAGITDPVASEVVQSWGPSGNNITGVSDVLPLSKRVALIKQLAPQARRIGVDSAPTKLTTMTRSLITQSKWGIRKSCASKLAAVSMSWCSQV